MNNGITKENLLFAVPIALREDESTKALAEAAAEVLAARTEEIDRLRIIPNIDGLEDALLNILARDFKVDWWDANYSLEEKRRTLKSSWRVHKMMGTKAAVETAISAIYPNAKVLEWFEYGGNPYGFKLQINLTGTDWTEDRPRRVLERVNFYKSLRSHLEELEYIREAKQPAFLRVGGTMAVITILPIPEREDTFNFEDTVRAGGTMAAIYRIQVPEQADTFNFEDTVRVGGTMGGVHRIPVPEQADIFCFEDTVRAGGTMAAAHSVPIPEQADTFHFEDTVRAGGAMASVHTIHIPENTTSTTSSRTGRVGVRGAITTTIPLPEKP